MLVIYKNGRSLKIPAAAYPLIYKPAGWELEGNAEEYNHIQGMNLQENNDENHMHDNLPESDNSEHLETKINAERDSELEELLETPLSEMSSEDLKTVAAKLGISVSGLRTKGELRAKIAECLEE